jgi:hypothetical protein
MAVTERVSAVSASPNGTTATPARKPRGPNVPKVLTFADHLAVTIKAFESMSGPDRERLIGVLRATYPSQG